MMVEKNLFFKSRLFIFGKRLEVGTAKSPMSTFERFYNRFTKPRNLIFLCTIILTLCISKRKKLKKSLKMSRVWNSAEHKISMNDLRFLSIGSLQVTFLVNKVKVIVIFLGKWKPLPNLDYKSYGQLILYLINL